MPRAEHAMSSPPADDASSPATQLGRLLSGFRRTQMIYVAAKLGIADQLAAGPRRVDELAGAVAADPPSLYRLLRALASLEIFAETDDGRFGLTPLAELLRTDAPDSLRPFALTYGEPWYWLTYGQLLHSVRTGQTAFERLHGQPFFDFLEQDAEAAAVFNANMTAMTRVEAAAVARTVDFADVRVLVDIGGGHGALVTAILERHPAMRAVLFDRSAVIAGARSHLEQAGLAGRCELVAGDFFAAVPGGGDVYTLKDIIHDWDDERAVSILHRCRDSMPAGARLLLIEREIPPGNQPAIGKLVDITMLVMTGGRERNESEYRALLDAAGFAWRQVVPVAGGTCVIEASPV
jgi:hypothetical protein